MEERSGRAGRILAGDRGRIAAIDLKWPEGRGSRAIAGTPKGEWKQLAQGWLKGPWHEIREGLGVRSVSGAAGSGTFLLLRRGTDGAAKVRAMRQRLEQRTKEGLQTIVRSCAQGRRDPGVIERRIGRLLGKDTGAARLVSVPVGRDASGRVVVTWSL
jgi:hypothetical protein